MSPEPTEHVCGRCLRPDSVRLLRGFWGPSILIGGPTLIDLCRGCWVAGLGMDPSVPLAVRQLAYHLNQEVPGPAAVSLAYSAHSMGPSVLETALQLAVEGMSALDSIRCARALLV